MQETRDITHLLAASVQSCLNSDAQLNDFMQENIQCKNALSVELLLSQRRGHRFELLNPVMLLPTLPMFEHVNKSILLANFYIIDDLNV